MFIVFELIKEHNILKLQRFIFLLNFLFKIPQREFLLCMICTTDEDNRKRMSCLDHLFVLPLYASMQLVERHTFKNSLSFSKFTFQPRFFILRIMCNYRMQLGHFRIKLTWVMTIHFEIYYHKIHTFFSHKCPGLRSNVSRPFRVKNAEKYEV